MRSDEVVTEQEQQSTAEIVHNTISDLRGEARRNFVHRLVNLIAECELGSHVVESPHMVAEATHEMMMEILDAERAPGSQGIHGIPKGSEGNPPVEATGRHGHFEAPDAPQGGPLGIH